MKDSAGNEWLCPLEEMKKAAEATHEKLDDCVELDGVTHTAGGLRPNASHIEQWPSVWKRKPAGSGSWSDWKKNSWIS